MVYLVRWWLLAELLGLLALPLCARLFRRLPDRGYGFSKVFGLLLVAYLAWIGGTVGLLPFSAGSLLIGLLVLGALGGSLLKGELCGLQEWWRRSRRYVFCSEAVFIAALLLVALLRSFQPAISGTEKPFEFANYNAVDRSAAFAPTDPWMSGKPDAYYYFGYVVSDGAAKLTGTPPGYAFNIALVMIAGLTAFTAFGLCANCAALLRRGEVGEVGESWPLVVGGAGVVLLMVIGNLEGVLELGAAHGWNPSWVYSHLDISGGGGLRPRPSTHWWPDEPGFGSWWRATRLGSDWNFLEFPFFSFLLGDLHPHVLSLPFKFLAGGFALGILVADGLPAPGARRRGWGLLAGAALSLGGLLAVHPWDFPPFALLICIALSGRVARDRTRNWRPALTAAAVAVAGALIIALPYLLNAGHGAISGIQPTEPFFIAQGSQNSINAEATYLPFQHLLLFWTPLMLPAAVFVAWILARRGRQALSDYGATALGLVALLPLVWVVAVWLRHGGAGLADELRVRGWGWLTVATLGLLLAASIAALAGELFGKAAEESRPVLVLLLGAVVVGVLLVYGPELFMVKDSSGTRANSTFKLWYSSWALLSVAGAVGGVWALWQARPRIAGTLLLRPAAAGACALVLAGALIYPLYASFNRTSGFTGPSALDGLSYLRTTNPDQLGAAGWLEANVPGVATILEATGNSYTEAGRIASLTGLPSVLGWQFHEQQERGNDPQIGMRSTDIQTIYTTADPTLAFQLLQRYGVQYVVVGQLERQTYGEAGLRKFADMGTLVFSSASVAIYRMSKPALFGAAG